MAKLVERLGEPWDVLFTPSDQLVQQPPSAVPRSCGSCGRRDVKMTPLALRPDVSICRRCALLAVRRAE